MKAIARALIVATALLGAVDASAGAACPVTALIGDLVGGGPAARRTREALVRCGPDAVPALITLAESSNANHRWEAVNLLGLIRDSRAIPALSKRALGDADVHARWRAIWALRAADDGTATAVLLNALSGSDREAASNAAVALSVFRRVEAVPVLHAMLQTADRWRQWEAVNALGAVHDDQTIDRLLPLLAHPDRDLRQEVVLTLGRLRRPAAVPYLIQAAADPDPQVRRRAAMVLGKLGDHQAAAPLRRALEREPDPRVAEEIRAALRALDP